MTKLIECVPNFSEGQDQAKMARIMQPFLATKGVKLLEYSLDEAYNRAVVTVIGEPEPLAKAVVEAVGIASQLIDLRTHKGEHPRMGATDVVPFIPIRNATMDDCIALAEKVASEISAQHDIPTYLYEKSARKPERENLANVRKGEYEGLAEKMQDPKWHPDFGPAVPHPQAGATAVCARKPLVAYNINLGTKDLKIAETIAKKIRYIGGGLRFVKAIGVELAERDLIQVSINMTDYTKTSLYQVFEMVRYEAERYGVQITGSEIIGLTPLAALVDAVAYYLRLEGFSPDQIIESQLLQSSNE